MHGLIFTSFRDYLGAVHGDAIEQDVMRGAPVYLATDAYGDEQFLALLERVVARTGGERDLVLHEFGVFTAETSFAKLYPALFALSHSAREFLLTVERPIHELVRVAIPDARPPQLAISEIDERSVKIVYDSPRRLCVLLRGLVEGTARHYRETVKLDERTCMHHADPACVFEARFNDGSPK